MSHQCKTLGPVGRLSDRETLYSLVDTAEQTATFFLASRVQQTSTPIGRIGMTMMPEDKTEMGCAILRYLQVHPDAKDSLAGIGQWWLLREWSERNLKDVEEALSDLVSKGLVVEGQTDGVTAYYCLNRTKGEEIAHLLDTK